MFFGSIPALVTPFSDGRVAEDTFAEFVEWQIAEGSNALVPCGTTGESATMSAAEQRRVIEIAVGVANKRVPVIAGCGSNNVAHAVEYLHAAKDVGADAALIVMGYYNRPSQAGMIAAFKALSDASAAADHRLQYSGPCGGRHRGRYAGRDWETAQHRGGQGRDGQSWPGHRAAPGERRGFHPAQRQRRNRAGLQCFWRRRAAYPSPPTSHRAFAPNSRPRRARAVGTKR